MYAIEEGWKKINGEVVKTYKRTIKEPATKLVVETGSTGYKGSSDRAGGGRTYVRLVCHKGDFFFDPFFNDDGNIIGFEIGACGDAGLDAILKALEFSQHAITE